MCIDCLPQSGTEDKETEDKETEIDVKTNSNQQKERKKMLKVTLTNRKKEIDVESNYNQQTARNWC